MYCLGIDIGGTNIAIGVVDEETMTIIAKHSNDTPVPCTQEVFCDTVAKTAKEAVEKSGITFDDIKQIGIGCPGTANKDLGVIEFANNLGYRDFEIVKMMAERLPNIPIKLENDANAAAYGEHKAGSLKDIKNGIAVTLGTGVGGGIIIDGQVYSSFNFSAGELGHIVIVADGRPCTCGRKGCWEAYSSATGLINMTKEHMAKCKDSKMWDIVDGDIEKVNGRTSFDAMRAGDECGKAVVDEYIHYLGIGIANVINVFQPEVLCIGGGISNERETLLAPLREIAEKETYVASKRTSLCRATLGNDAGIIGVALAGL